MSLKGKRFIEKISMLTFLVFQLIWQKPAHAKQLTFECDNSGKLINLSLEDSSTSALNANNDQLKELVRSGCQDLQNCISETKSISSLVPNVVTSAVLLDQQDKYRKQDALDRQTLLSHLSEINASIERCQTKKDQKSDQLALFYRFRGPNSNKISKNYSRSRIEFIVATALEQEVDPFLALAITVQESPPTIDRVGTGSGSYDQRYGAIPIDETPTLETLGCISNNWGPGHYLYNSDETVSRWNQLNADYKRTADRLRTIFPDDLANQIGITDFLAGTSSYHDEEIKFRWLTWSERQSKEEIEKINQQNGYDPKASFERDSRKFDQTLSSHNSDQRALEAGALKNDLISIHRKRIELLDSLARQYPEKKAGIIAELFALMKLDKKINVGFIKSPDKIRTFTIGNAREVNSEYLLCTASGDINTGFAPTLHLVSRVVPQGCCAKVKARAGLTEDMLASEFKSTLALSLLKRLVYPSSSNRDKSISWLVQGYNGRGCIGCSEELKNSCLQGLNTKDRPIYGAQVADLMVNTLIANPTIQGIVQKALRERGDRTPSFFCEKYGPGKHNIDDRFFLSEQEDYLLRGAEHPYLMESKNQRGQLEFRLPTSEQDWDQYKRRESQRRSACQKLFSNPWIK